VRPFQVHWKEIVDFLEQAICTFPQELCHEYLNYFSPHLSDVLYPKAEVVALC
jgi:hypothetical protein